MTAAGALGRLGGLLLGLASLGQGCGGIGGVVGGGGVSRGGCVGVVGVPSHHHVSAVIQPINVHLDVLPVPSQTTAATAPAVLGAGTGEVTPAAIEDLVGVGHGYFRRPLTIYCML